MTTFLSVPSILAEAQRLLETGGYTVTRNLSESGFPSAYSFVAEDPYCVVALFVFETWHDLSEKWSTAQSSMVELISKKLQKGDPKLWEGYLVLLTTAPAASDSNLTIEQIRYDIARIRKLIGVGEQLSSLEDIKRVLLPLLPLEIATTDKKQSSMLDSLPDLLVKHGQSREVVDVVLRAFRNREPVFSRLHEYLSSK